MTAHQNGRQEISPLQRANFSADGDQHSRESATLQRLQVGFKAIGHRLTRTIEPDGTTTYFVGCGSFSREVSGIDAAGEFLKAIGDTAL